MYELQPKFSAYGQYKRGARAPSPDELYGSWNMDQSYAGVGQQYALVGNTALRKETSDALDFGLKGEPTPGVSLRSSLFYTRYKDFIGYTPLHPRGGAAAVHQRAGAHRHHLPGGEPRQRADLRP